MRRKQLHTLDHPLLLVIEEPGLTRLKAGYDRMPGCRRMLGCMLIRRTVAASDVSTLRTSAEMKPPIFRRCQAFHTPIATRLRGGVDSAPIFFHFSSPFRPLCRQKMSSHQQNPPTAALFRCGLSFSSNIRTAGPQNRSRVNPFTMPRFFLNSSRGLYCKPYGCCHLGLVEHPPGTDDHHTLQQFRASVERSGPSFPPPTERFRRISKSRSTPTPITIR